MLTTLRVYPNPFAAFDKHGTPCGLCPRDPDADAGGPGLFVGARPDKKNTQVLQDFKAMHTATLGARGGAMAASGEIRSPQQLTRYEYMGVPSVDPELATKLAAKDPIEIPATKYYKAELLAGSLLPADIETAEAAKLPRFVPPAAFFQRYAPALPEAPAREGITLPADGAIRTVELS